MNKSLPMKNHKKHKENDIRQRIKRQRVPKQNLDKSIAARKTYKEAHYYKEYFRNIKKYVNWLFYVALNDLIDANSENTTISLKLGFHYGLTWDNMR